MKYPIIIQPVLNSVTSVTTYFVNTHDQMKGYMTSGFTFEYDRDRRNQRFVDIPDAHELIVLPTLEARLSKKGAWENRNACIEVMLDEAISLEDGKPHIKYIS